MNPAVYLKTKEGHAFYLQTWSDFEEAKERFFSIDSFRQILSEKMKVVDLQLSCLLEDDEYERLFKMDASDKEGWRIYNTLTDEHSTLKHFISRKVDE